MLGTFKCARYPPGFYCAQNKKTPVHKDQGSKKGKVLGGRLILLFCQVRGMCVQYYLYPLWVGFKQQKNSRPEGRPEYIRIKSLKQLLSDRRRCRPLPVHFSPGSLSVQQWWPVPHRHQWRCHSLDVLTSPELCNLGHERKVGLDPILTVNG